MPAATILILHASPFFAQLLHQRVQSVFPHATCLIVSTVVQAAAVLCKSRADVLVTGLEAAEGDVLDMLLHLKRNRQLPACTFVVTGLQGVRTLVTLRRLAIRGVFNLPDEPENFAIALGAVAGGRTYWSQVFLAATMSRDAAVVEKQLPPAEQLALSFIGDGCSDKVASERMGMGLCAVRSLRQRMHARLGVHDKEGLQRLAMRWGYTRPTRDGFVPIGAAILMVEYLERSKRPVDLPPRLLERHGFAADNNPFGSNPPFRTRG